MPKPMRTDSGLTSCVAKGRVVVRLMVKMQDKYLVLDHVSDHLNHCGAGHRVAGLIQKEYYLEVDKLNS